MGRSLALDKDYFNLVILCDPPDLPLVYSAPTKKPANPSSALLVKEENSSGPGKQIPCQFLS